MHLVLCIPLNRQSERRYVSNVVFGEFLGLDVKIIEEERTDWCLTDSEGCCRLIMPDSFLNLADRVWLKPDSMPVRPLPIWRAVEALPEATLVKPELPIIAGEPERGRWYVEVDHQTVRLGLDVLGSAFFMLTRYEEIVNPERDKHDRFPAAASLAYQEGFLERPIINEYVEILWAAMKRIWPGLKRTKRIHRILLSHDVDVPLCTLGKSTWSVLKSTIGDIVKRRDPQLAIQRLTAYAQAKHENYDNDPCNTFDFIMGLSKKYGLESAFYFMAVEDNYEPKARYDIEYWWFRKLLRQIYDRGFEIGLHTSYNTYGDPDLTRKEYQKLIRVMEEEKLQQEQIGGRQHYLRWENPVTWQNWNNSGLDYDSTLSYADHVGFRCGVCYEFPVFDIIKGQELKLRERPLIVMDGTMFSYMRLSYDDTLTRIVQLNKGCKVYNGDFTILWHNSSMISKSQRQFYEYLLEKLT